jgi:hypothetical protein
MYKGNLLETVSPKRQEQLKYWFGFSCVCAILLAGFIAMHGVRYWVTITKLKQQVLAIKARLHKVTPREKESESLQTHTIMLQKKIDFLQHYITAPKTPFSCIDVISHKIPEGMRLTACSIGAKRTVELRGKTLGYNHIVMFIEALHESTCFKGMHITHLHAIEKTPHDATQLFDFTVKGFLLKK